MAEQLVIDQPAPENSQAIVQSPKTPMELLQWAVTNGANVDQLGKLMEYQLRWQAEEARLAWIRDMEAFKAECPEIIRTKVVKQTAKEGKTAPQYSHAELDKICDVVIPLLRKHNFTHGWKSECGANGVTVTCLIRHNLGHVDEQTSLTGPPDVSGGKNAIQAIGSSTYYLERYTLLAALGLAPKNQDTDGVVPGIPTGRRAEQCEWIANCRKPEELLRVWKAAHEEASAVRDYDAIRLYIEAKDKRKDEIAGGEL